MAMSTEQVDYEVALDKINSVKDVMKKTKIEEQDSKEGSSNQLDQILLYVMKDKEFWDDGEQIVGDLEKPVDYKYVPQWLKDSKDHS